MPTSRSPVVFTRIFLVLFIPLTCQSCQNAVGNFQELLKGRKLPGRFTPSSDMKLSNQLVFTKMECLDICLRNAECGSFEMRQTRSRNKTTTPWICVINRRINSRGTMPNMYMAHAYRWMHFAISSEDLQGVSCIRYLKDKAVRPLTLFIISNSIFYSVKHH